MGMKMHLKGSKVLHVEKFKPKESVFVLGKQSLKA